MNEQMLKLLLIIETLDKEQLERVKAWVDYNIEKKEKVQNLFFCAKLQ